MTHSDLDCLRVSHVLTDSRTGATIGAARFMPDYCARANEVNVQQGLPHLVWRPAHEAVSMKQAVKELEYWWDKE